MYTYYNLFLKFCTDFLNNFQDDRRGCSGENGRKIHISSSVNSEGNYWKNVPYELDTDYNIVVQQFEEREGIWIYEITVNGEVLHSIQNNNPKEYRNVRFYAGDNSNNRPFTSEYGKIWDIKINDHVTGKGLIICCH